MAILPQTNIDLSQGVIFQEWPTRTYYVDQTTKRIVGMTDGQQAMRQAVEIILNIERFYWQIYSPYFGMQWDGLIGQSPGYVASEIQRRLKDAFSTDDRILGISDFTYTSDDESLSASFTVNTVYGSVDQTLEITI
jgi:hypothetical protein|nr:MAG TPA: Protein of unknown function (DUF2634) [Caudoviricetes sp.]